MGFEIYNPSPEEVQKAEVTMTPEQKAASAGRGEEFFGGKEFEEESNIRKRNFNGINPELTDRYKEELARLKEKIENAAPWVRDRYSLVVQEPVSTHSAEALSFYGILKIAPKFLKESSLERFSYAIAVHERLHLQIGGELRRTVFAKHDDVDAFFHETILPIWYEGKLELPLPDSSYEIDELWKRLYPGNYVYSFNLEGAIETLDLYFAAAKRDAIEFLPDGMMSIPHPRISKSAKMIFQQSPMSIADLFNKNPQKFLKVLINGYAVGEKLREKYLSTMEYKYQQPLLEYEEGFANYVSSSLTGVSPEELQRVAPTGHL